MQNVEIVTATDLELEITGLRREIVALRRTNRGLLDTIASLRTQMRDALAMSLGMIRDLTPLVREYVRLKDASESAVTKNNRAATNFSRGQRSGQFHSPLEVIAAVNAWRVSAIEIAEWAARQVTK